MCKLDFSRLFNLSSIIPDILRPKPPKNSYEIFFRMCPHPLHGFTRKVDYIRAMVLAPVCTDGCRSRTTLIHDVSQFCLYVNKLHFSSFAIHLSTRELVWNQQKCLNNPLVDFWGSFADAASQVTNDVARHVLESTSPSKVSIFIYITSSTI